MEEKQTRLLRFFAEDPAAREKAIAAFVEAGQVTAEVREKNGETLLLLTSCMDSKAAGTVVLDNCVERERAACGAALYAAGQENLYEALVAAMQQSGMLFTPADETAGKWLSGALKSTAGADALCDFGSESYAHPKNGPRILAAVRTAHPLAAAQARITAACRLTGADWAVACAKQETGDALLVGNERGSWMLPLAEIARPPLWAADLLRRAALGLPQAAGVVWAHADATAQLTAADAETGKKARLRAGLYSLAATVLCMGLGFAAFWLG